MRKRICLALALLITTAAVAQEKGTPKKTKKLIGVEEARRHVQTFLTRGPAPIRPRLTKNQVRSMEVREEKEYRTGPTYELSLRWRTGRSVLNVTVARRTGRVVSLHQADRETWIESARRDASGKVVRKTKAEIAEEIAVRSAVDVTELRRRAWRYLAQLYPDLATRRFKLVSERLTKDGLLRRGFLFVEQKPAGALAFFPNRAKLSLSPETGALVSAHITDASFEVRQPPKVTSKRAEATARTTWPKVPAGAPARSWLAVDFTEQGDPFPVWVVTLGERDPHRVLIEANTGRVTYKAEPLLRTHEAPRRRRKR